MYEQAFKIILRTQFSASNYCSIEKVFYNLNKKFFFVLIFSRIYIFSVQVFKATASSPRQLELHETGQMCFVLVLQKYMLVHDSSMFTLLFIFNYLIKTVLIVKYSVCYNFNKNCFFVTTFQSFVAR